MMNNNSVKDLLIKVGTAVAHRVHQSLTQQSMAHRSAIFKQGEDDTIFQIDRDVEEVIVPLMQEAAAELGGIFLLAEGIGDDVHGLSLGAPDGQEPALRIIMDPIDGTRGIMYDKRSAFFLAAAAPNLGPGTRLSDAEVAVMVELPTSRSRLADVLWAVRGQGIHAYTLNLDTNEQRPQVIAPSSAKNLAGGFAQLVRFFPPGREILSRIEDRLIAEVTPNFDPSRAIVFEDQYISTGGQLYEMLIGHDRFIADLRHQLYQFLATQGLKGGHVCHPYDACTLPLMAAEAGVLALGVNEKPFDAPMDLTSPADWMLFANQHIYNLVWPVLRRLLREEQLLDD